jgi:hypothetical protein
VERLEVHKQHLKLGWATLPSLCVYRAGGGHVIFGQKFTDIEQVLNYLIKKGKQSIQQHERKQVGYKNE